MTGCAIIGQTADLAPADKRVYAIRDVTATVESVPLITASILSKKLAAGLGSLVLDVKTGTGAFMQSREDSRALATSLVEVANGAGLKTSALITDMNEPLATAAGNAVEVATRSSFSPAAPATEISPRSRFLLLERCCTWRASRHREGAAPTARSTRWKAVAQRRRSGEWLRRSGPPRTSSREKIAIWVGRP